MREFGTIKKDKPLVSDIKNISQKDIALGYEAMANPKVICKLFQQFKTIVITKSILLHFIKKKKKNENCLLTCLQEQTRDARCKVENLPP